MAEGVGIYEHVAIKTHVKARIDRNRKFRYQRSQKDVSVQRNSSSHIKLLFLAKTVHVLLILNCPCLLKPQGLGITNVISMLRRVYLFTSHDFTRFRTKPTQLNL
jgi:hypothetical protein